MTKQMLASHAAIVPLTTANVSGGVTPTGNAVPTLGLGSYTYSQTYSAPTSLIAITSFGFYDDYVFDVPASLANSIASTISLSNLLGIDNLQVRLYQAPASLNLLPILGNPTLVPYSLALYDGWSSPMYFAGFTATTAILPVTPLVAGRYVLEVRGSVVGSAGGSYTGVLNVTPVPLPPGLPLLLGGMGLLAMFALFIRRLGPPVAATLC
jgi:hypothetical protein